MAQSAVQPILASQDFINDLRRVTKKAMHPRVLVEIDTEVWLNTLPPEIQYDKAKVADAMTATINDISEVINEAKNADGELEKFSVLVFDSPVGQGEFKEIVTVPNCTS